MFMVKYDFLQIKKNQDLFGDLKNPKITKQFKKIEMKSFRKFGNAQYMRNFFVQNIVKTFFCQNRPFRAQMESSEICVSYLNKANWPKSARSSMWSSG